MPTLDELEKRVAQLESRPKDPWDIAQAIGGLLLPAAIAYGGWYYSEAQSRAQIVSSQQMHERDVAVANVGARVNQASLVATFMEALTGDDPERRNLAIRAVLIALPEEGPDLVREVQVSTSDTSTARYAADALDTRRDVLIDRLFAPRGEDRIRASQDLLRGWGTRAAMVPALIRRARQEPTNANGLYNVLGVLVQMDAGALRAARADVEPFLGEAERAPAAGARIRALVQQVRSRLDSPGGAG